jgi:ribonuclease R
MSSRQPGTTTNDDPSIRQESGGNAIDASLEERILACLRDAAYHPLKPKALARRLDISAADYAEFRDVLKLMARRGQAEFGLGRVVKLPSTRNEIVGTYKSIRKGGGFVTPKVGQFRGQREDIYISPGATLDAATGDIVLVALKRRDQAPDRKSSSSSRKSDYKSARSPEGRIVEIIERSSREFVGTYFTKDAEAFVHVDGTIFHEPIYVGDPGAKGAVDGDKVVFEMLRFPSPQMLGEGVIREILGPRGDPDADLKAILRQFRIPENFSEQALAEAREQAKLFEEAAPDPHRSDLTNHLIITIDPVDARDFDDAIDVERDENGHWKLGVHIADVSTFVQPGTSLDGEARARGTSVYLPGKVIPMLPELLSNGLASLQENRPRYTKSVFVDFDPEGRITHVSFANTVIKVARRFSYEQVQEFFDAPAGRTRYVNGQIAEMLEKARQLARILRERRRARGYLELSMPEARVDVGPDGHVTGATYSKHDESHQLIEEFMLTANEAVAQELKDRDLAFLRRVHENPDPIKLHAFAEFVRSLGLQVEDETSRFELQRIVREIQGKPEEISVNYALLRSMKEAVYSPEEEGHYALASPTYCHFTSPIRRYPDLTIHRMLDGLIRHGKAGYDFSELVVLGEHCSFAERRAQKAERELVKVKVLEFLKDKVGQILEMVITGVEEFGMFAQAKIVPAEGLIHIRTMSDDYYVHDSIAHTLTGQRQGREYRLGMTVRCVIAKVDLDQRQLDLRLESPQGQPVSRPKRRGSPPPPRRSAKKKGRSSPPRRPGKKKSRRR